MSEPDAVFAYLRRRSEVQRDWTILQYGHGISSQAKSQSAFEILCGAHICRVTRSKRQSAISIEPSKRYPRNSTKSRRRSDRKRLATGLGVRGKHGELAVSPPCPSVRSANRDSVPEARLRCPAQRPDARANPPAHLSRFLRPGDIEAFDGRLRCPASNVAKAPTNTGSNVGGAPRHDICKKFASTRLAECSRGRMMAVFRFQRRCRSTLRAESDEDAALIGSTHACLSRARPGDR